MYDSATGDWCISKTGSGASNAASCSQPSALWPSGIPALSGPMPTGMKFPAWAYDKNLSTGKAVHWVGASSVYTYDAKQNQWALTTVPGTTPVMPTQKSGVSWAYDDIHDTFVLYLSNTGGTNSQWQLPGNAIAL
jgi:hypothetical protein